MTRTVYVNGEYVPETEAKISVFDRGFLFADAVYEVTSVLGGKLIDFHAHMARLDRSLSELDMTAPASHDELLAIHRELVTRNAVDEGMIYMQVTRGAADRDFLYPPKDTAPSLVLFTQALGLRDKPVARTGLRIAAIEDLRWGRCDIKTVQLLYPSMAKMAAKAKGVDDAWMVADGVVTEGSSNNAHIVTTDGTLVTRPLSHAILAGITRAAVLRMAKEHDVKVEERTFTLDEAKQAKEAFITSASMFVMPVVEIDGARIGDGKPGDLTQKMRAIYIDEAEKSAI